MTNTPRTSFLSTRGSVFAKVVVMDNEEAPRETCLTDPTLTHTYERGKCVECGASQPAEETFLEEEPHG